MNFLPGKAIRTILFLLIFIAARGFIFPSYSHESTHIELVEYVDIYKGIFFMLPQSLSPGVYLPDFILRIAGTFTTGIYEGGFFPALALRQLKKRWPGMNDKVG